MFKCGTICICNTFPVGRASPKTEKIKCPYYAEINCYTEFWGSLRTNLTSTFNITKFAKNDEIRFLCLLINNMTNILL